MEEGFADRILSSSSKPAVRISPPPVLEQPARASFPAIVDKAPPLEPSPVISDCFEVDVQK